uniref:Hypothetical chloroplast RF20 n=1 Tax=Marsupiomonas sp. NIES 1824 TaxID=1562198 RepID=A0A097KLY8_9CHLO|nr:hypothetical chloroplast RF20 [Marsupiomonas sp. NIES 1824]
MRIKDNIQFFLKKLFSSRLTILPFFLSILLGIFFGSIFGTFLPFLRQFFVWDGLIFLLILFVSEWVSVMMYQQNLKLLKNQNRIQFLNWLKMGTLLGFFIDAFKVGS